ncbi:Aldehyde dehydrogenase 22A1 [Platanthera guangdongensis]|uniref:Aldehyde dehydrogenase 22A1 n=1 Tax=Platanthera guangdongensis TaxID=2320717 RepID=A0ABR2LX96_9ASPA
MRCCIQRLQSTSLSTLPKVSSAQLSQRFIPLLPQTMANFSQRRKNRANRHLLNCSSTLVEVKVHCYGPATMKYLGSFPALTSEEVYLKRRTIASSAVLIFLFFYT